MCTRPSLPGRIVHERAEVHQARDLALVDPADFDVGGDQLDAPLRFAAGDAVDRSDLHRAVVLDVDRACRSLR